MEAKKNRKCQKMLRAEKEMKSMITHLVSD